MKKEIYFKNWNKDEWKYITNNTHPNITEFTQNKDYIKNTYDNNKKPQYISMIYNDDLKENFTISTKCSFESYGAPIIVIADEPTKLKNNILKYNTYIEIVLYENGINLWHINNKTKKVTQIIREEFKVENNKIHNLIVSVDLNKSWIIVSLNNENIKHIIPWPKLSKFKKYYTGITACEGINRFYNFIIK